MKFSFKEIQARLISVSCWAAGLEVKLCSYTCFLTEVVFGDFLTEITLQLTRLARLLKMLLTLSEPLQIFEG